MYEMNVINSQKRHWSYDEHHMNNSCSTEKNNCLVFSSLSSSVVPYNRKQLHFVALGRDKKGEPLNIYFSKGLFGKESKSIPHHVKSGSSVFKLNPLEIKYDELNFMNGVSVSTHPEVNGENNAAELVF